MKRLKRVVDSRGVAHLWANKVQSDARNPNGSLYFNGDTIYSYGSHFPIARHLNNNVIFFTTRDYSNTTSKHKLYVHRAIPDTYKVFMVQDVRLDYHNDNLEYYYKQMELFYNKMLKALSNGRYYQQEANSYASYFADYYHTFKIKDKMFYNKMDALHSKINNPPLATIEKWKRYKDGAELRAKNKSRIKNEDKAHLMALNYELWREGKENYSIWCYNPMWLRVKDDYIQTSAGASVKLESAKVLYEMIKRGIDIKGHKIDGYTVISLNGVLKIGCHNIPLSEVDRIATQLNWK